MDWSSISKESGAGTGTRRGWKPRYPFDLVIGYEDSRTRQRAFGLCDHLAQSLANEHDFTCAWWKFEHLRERSLMARAVAEASAANMIILSLSAQRPLSDLATAWIEAWSGRKEPEKRALVALIDTAEAAAQGLSDIRAYLESVAQRADMDLFLHVTDADNERHIYTVENLAARAETVTPLLHEILEHKGSATSISLR